MMDMTFESRLQQQALLKGDDVLERHMDRAIERSVQEMARSARGYAPKAFSTLTQSIRVRRPNSLEGIVAPGVDYAQIVEEGTLKNPGFPPIDSIEDWIKVKGIIPNDPSMDTRDLAYVMARSIALKGTPAQEFMQPAFDDNKDRAERRLQRALDSAIQEIGPN